MQKSMSKKKAAMKLGLAAVASVALTFGAAMPAFAADVQLGPGNIAPYEIGDEGSSSWNYDQWHIGSESNDTSNDIADSLAFGECQVTLGVPSAGVPSWVQVMKGFPIDGRPATTPEGNVDSVRALVNSTSIEVVTGSVTIQIPAFIRVGDQTLFTTFRSELLAPGSHELAGMTVSNSRIPEIPDGAFTFTQLVDLLATGQGPVVQLLGVGFNGSEDASVSRLGFSGVNNYFGTGTCITGSVTPPKKVETAA